MKTLAQRRRKIGLRICITTPAEATVALKNFVATFQRYEKNEYKTQGLRTYDVSQLNNYVKFVGMASVAIHNRNQEYAIDVIESFSEVITKVRELRNNAENRVL